MTLLLRCLSLQQPIYTHHFWSVAYLRDSTVHIEKYSLSTVESLSKPTGTNKGFRILDVFIYLGSVFVFFYVSYAYLFGVLISHFDTVIISDSGKTSTRSSKLQLHNSFSKHYGAAWKEFPCRSHSIDIRYFLFGNIYWNVSLWTISFVYFFKMCRERSNSLNRCCMFTRSGMHLDHTLYGYGFSRTHTKWYPYSCAI